MDILQKLRNGRLIDNVENIAFSLLVFFLPTQLGKHFWPSFSLISGIRIDYLSPTLYFTDVIILLLFVLFILKRYRQKNFFRVATSGRLFSFFILFCLLTVLISGQFGNGLYSIGRLLEFSFLAYYVSYSVKTIKKFAHIVFILSLSVFLQSLLTLAQYIKQGAIGGLFYYFGERYFTPQTPGIANASINGQLILRPYGTFSHPNVLAGFLVVSMVLILFSFFLRERVSIKVVQLGSLLVGTVALFLSLSRIAIAIWMIVLLLCFVFSLRRIFWQKHARQHFFVLSIGIILFVLLFFLTPFHFRFTQTTFTEESVIQREALVNASLQMFSSHPLLGVGAGNFLHVLAEMKRPLSLSFSLQPVHAIFLLIASEIGLVGLCVSLWFVLRTYRRLLIAIRDKRNEIKIYLGYAIAFSTIIITGLFDHYWLTLQQGQLLFAFIIGLCWTHIDHVQKHSIRKQV